MSTMRISMTLRISLTIVLLFAITALSFVIPNADGSDSRDRGHDDNNIYSNHALHRLNPMQGTNNLFCRSSQQSMSCYGGPAVTLQTCQSRCACDDGRISCPSYKYCDDSTMDTFCGGLCQCGAPLASSPNTNVNSNSDAADFKPKIINKEPEIVVMSPHRYPAPVPRRQQPHQFDSDEEEDSAYFEDEDDDFRRRRRSTRRDLRRSTDQPVVGFSV
ncbi:hypothetical protein ABEF95_006693 [Exophiala dermatitidis]